MAKLKNMVRADLKELLDIADRKMMEAGVNIAIVGREFLSELVMHYACMLLKTYLDVVNKAALRASAEERK